MNDTYLCKLFIYTHIFYFFFNKANYFTTHVLYLCMYNKYKNHRSLSINMLTSNTNASLFNIYANACCKTRIIFIMSNY